MAACNQRFLILLLFAIFSISDGSRQAPHWPQHQQYHSRPNQPNAAGNDEPRVILEPGTSAPIPDPNAPPGTSSLTFVFDVTGSMYDDLVQVREGAKRIFATVLEQREKLIHNYVLVPFHDPEVGPVVATSDTQYFQRKLQNLYVQGGGDCPEMAISGVKLALEASLPSSFIYVFTDARAKDYQLTDQVLNLIQDRQSQVVFVMTGDCGNRSHPGYKAFERIASTSSGQVFHLEKSDVNEVLNYVRVAVQTRKVHISSVDRDVPGSFLIDIPIDAFLHEFTISLSGDDPEIQLSDPSGQPYREGPEVKPILDLGNAIIYNIREPKPGTWRLSTTAKSKHTVRVTGLGEIAFSHGFAPRFLQDVTKAHYRPLKNVMTFLMVNISGLMPPGLVNQIGLIDLEGNILYRSQAIMDKTNPFLYHVGPFMPPDGYYFVKVTGVDDRNFEFQRISSTAIHPQPATGPKAYMSGRTVAYHGQSANLTCSIESRTPFTLYWYKSMDKIGGPFYYRYSDTAFWAITDLTSADAGEYKCVVSSAAGNDTASTLLETRDAPPQIIAPRNVTATLGATAQLHCRTQSIGPSTITWQRKGIPIQSSAQFTVFPNGTINISPISKSDEGGYVCHVITAGGSARAEIYLAVLEAPKVTVYPSTLYFVDKGAFNISCSATGDPAPEVGWYFRNEKVRPSGKHYVSYKHDLLVRGATKDDQGRYECRATSPSGVANNFATVQIAEPPKVVVARDKEMIGRGDTVTLECQITAGIPGPSISWYRGGREVTAFRYISIQNGRLTVQGAQDADGGVYTCVAENMAGRAEAKIKVDVGSVPSIVPSPDTITVNIERDVTLPCRATGHPTPEVTWTKDGKPLNNARYTAMPDGGLLIRAAILEDVGRYTCTATNRFGRQDAVRTLIVSGLVSPVLGHVSTEEQVTEGQSLRLGCVIILGTPKPTLHWFKDGRPVKDTANIRIQSEGSMLSITGAKITDQGRYMCMASNAAGNATVNVNVNVITKPAIEPGQSKMSAKEGERVEVMCKVKGKPAPTVTWTKEGRPLLHHSAEYFIKTDGTLVFYRVRPSDAGSYQCNAANPAGEASRTMKVEIRVSPKISPDLPIHSVKLGERLIIPCEVTGMPIPKLTWTLNGKPLSFDRYLQLRPDGSLVINQIKEEHRGEYRCIAKNEVGQDARVVTVNVHTAPVIVGSDEIRTVTARVNETIRLQCPARADPPPTREWVLEGRKIYRGFYHGSEFRLISDGTLEIVGVQVQNAGRYICIVSNVAGNDSVAYILKVEAPPRIISDIPASIDVVLGTKLDIPCRSVGTPVPSISWQKDGFHIVSSADHTIDATGTLRITQAKIEHAGRYTCTAKNTAGTDTRVTQLAVQEPPVIAAGTLTSHTAIQGERVELRCTATGTPTPQISWYRHGTAVKNENGVRVFPDGRLIIEMAKETDHGPYLCKAVNPAGEASQDIMLTVIVPPTIPDPISIINEEVLLGSPFTLYCPVSSTPIPEISWFLQEKPVAEADPNIQLSEDKRRLHTLKARVTDAGLYKCVARNAAGQSSKSFKVEVLVPPNLDESKQKRKMTVILNQPISINCPVSAVPDPSISWLFNGQLLQVGAPPVKGIQVIENGKQLRISSSQLDHDGTYTCVATNKAGSLDVDVLLSVLAPPFLGENEILEIVVGSVVTMNCNPRGDGAKPTIAWMKGDKEAESSDPNVQIALEGRKLYINRVTISNEGLYICVVRNTAGESRKSFQLKVLVPPEFREKQFEPTLQQAEGQPLVLACRMTGNPQPEVMWEKDGQSISTNSLNGYEISENGMTLKIPKMYKGLSSRFTCIGKNKAGAISRDFFVQAITPPRMEGGERIQLEVVRGSSALMECPIETEATSTFQLVWKKDGRGLPESQASFQLSLDRQRLHMTNVQEEDEGIYMCVARNPAGTASREFQLHVLRPPSLIGDPIEQIEVLEGQALTMRCQYDADPMPKVNWLKDGIKLPSKAQVLSDNITVYISSITKSDAGAYFCAVANKAGIAEKTFHVRVVLKPSISGEGEEQNVEVTIGQAVTLDCPVTNTQDVDIQWLWQERPLNKEDPNMQTVAGGRHLNIMSSKKEDAGRYSCVAKNKAGSTVRRINLIVLVPPMIKGEGGEHSAVVNQSLTLPCETDGVPKPTITWTKNGENAATMPNVQVLSEGQQFRISPATQGHSGQYICTATNKVGTADVRFDVDVIAPPAVSEYVKDTIEVLVNHSTTLRCPVKNDRYSRSIVWLRDRRLLLTRGNPKYIESQNGRKLHLSSIQLPDEGTYSCRVKNRAGEKTVDFKLVVLEPPKILMLDKDKNQTLVENSTLALNCPASGKPEPEIRWYKEGEQLTPLNMQKRMPGADLLGNTLRVPRVQTVHAGRYTCFAQNKAGLAEQDVLVYVTTVPRIEREGIPSTIQAILEQRATISCPVYGRPTPMVTWLKAGRPLDPNEKIYYSSNKQKLHFVALGKEDLDQYTCVAQNSAGEDRRDFKLEALVAPSIAGVNLPRHVQVIIGRSTMLECPAVGSPDPIIAWMKNGQPIRDGGRIRTLNGGRQLQISDAKLDDTARYNCIASNPIGVVDLDTFVDVVGPPTVDGRDMDVLEVVESQAITLVCDITGTEPLDIEWTRNGQSVSMDEPTNAYMQIASTGRRLHILAAQTSDQGRYVCIGRNRAGEARKTFDLRVYMPPSINDTASSPAVQKVNLGHQFKIECKVTGNPFPQITWYKDGSPFSPDPKDPLVKVLYDNQTLWFSRIMDSHGGRYLCVATNKVGSAEKDFILQLKGPPQVDEPLVTKEANVGDYVMLACTVIAGTGKMEITWLIDERPVESKKDINPAIKMEDKRLEIRESRLSDTGRYTCLVRNEAGEARKHFDLSILEQPRFLDTVNVAPSIVEGRQLVLDCSVRGTPKPTVTWTKDGQDLTISGDQAQFINENQQYRVAVAEEKDAGRYTCIAENKAGRAEKDLVVDVQMPPKMDPTTSHVEAVENETVSLECPVKGVDLHIQWSRNGIAITHNNHVQVSSNGRKLHLTRIQTTHAGRYSCLARNDAGQAFTDIEVVVLVPPKISAPVFQTVEGLVNQTLQMECRASGIPEPKIEWMKDGRPLAMGSYVDLIYNGTYLRLNNIQPSHEGRYSCAAINKVGRAEADTFLQIIAPPNIVKSPVEAKVMLGQNQIIRCNVSGNPVPTVTWLKNGQALDTALIHASIKNHYVHIVNAKLTDAGRYTCVAKSRAGEDRHTTALSVLVPPTILAGERILNVIENRSLVIECLADGTPEPVLKWYKDGRLLAINGKTKETRRHRNLNSHNYQIIENRLIIPQAQLKDAGRYTCEAESAGAGTASADFAVDVYVRPYFVDLVNTIRVIEGDRATLDCKVEAKPPAQLTWLRGGRPLDMKSSHFILSPRGHRLIILNTKRGDAGSYSCVAKNAAGDNEANFQVAVLVPPHMANPIDQNPKVIVKQNATIECPVIGTPLPVVEWRKDGQPIPHSQFGRYRIDKTSHTLHIFDVQMTDKARYTCHAVNEAGFLDTDFIFDVSAPPKFSKPPLTEYEVIQGKGITLDCQAEADPKPEIVWLKGDSAVYLDKNVWLSADSQHLTLSDVQLAGGGRYTCRATNIAGTTDVDMILHVLVPPSIDKSNIIGNPLAIVNKSISIECPAAGVPPPTVSWLKDGQQLPGDSTRISYSYDNQTLRIENVLESDAGRYTCMSTNKAGHVEQDFTLEVLTPPAMDTSAIKGQHTLIETDSLTLVCPVIATSGKATEITWTKDGRPLDPANSQHVRISQDHRRLHITSTKLGDSGVYSCIASNRAGETQMEFQVELMSEPQIDGSRNDPQAHVVEGQPQTLWCVVTGRPHPMIMWMKDGVPLNVTQMEGYSLIDRDQGLRMEKAGPKDSGRYTCVVKNPAGTKELDISLDVWVAPSVKLDADRVTIPLGQSLSLHCRASGNPTPRIQWTKDGQGVVTSSSGPRISQDNTRLDIRRVRIEDGGRYACAALNEAGTMEDSKDIEILLPPAIRRQGIDLNPRVALGQMFTMTCEADGKPAPKITWYKDGVLLRASKKVEIAQGGVYVQINDADGSDKGLYRCQAVNDAGDDYLLYNVDIIQSPVIGPGGTVQVIENQTAVMDCDTKAVPPPIVHWLRNGHRVTSKDRYHVSNKTLSISSARSADAGIYVCVSSNDIGIAQQAYTLEVLIPPKIARNTPKEIGVPQGKQFEMKCTAQGYPPPQILWFKGAKNIDQDEKYLLQSDGTLLVADADTDDEGPYKCIASNPAGTDERQYQVLVIQPPKIAEQETRVINITQRDPLTLVCQVQSDPVPHIVWYKDGTQLSGTGQSGRFILEQDSTRLRLSDTRLTDSGNYSCEAANPAGNVTQQFVVYVGIAPEITDDVRRIVVANGTRTDIPCEAIGHPTPTIQWTFNSTSLSQSHIRGNSIVFSKVGPQDAGAYVCTATNWVATATKQVQLIVLSRPQIIPEHFNLTVKENGTAIFSCNVTDASGNPSWFKEPNLPLVSNNKYSIENYTLRIGSVKKEDAGYYRCVAKNEAGAAVGFRRLTVELARPMRIVWVPCDEKGKPIRESYVPARGDTPSTNQQWLPWSSESAEFPENGTDGTFLKCLPNEHRKQRNQGTQPQKPMLVELPKTQDIREGSVLTLTCGAIGSPPPEIFWLHNQTMMAERPVTNRGRSILKMNQVRYNHSGVYTCMARNQYGSTRVAATVRVKESPRYLQTEGSKNQGMQVVSILNCKISPGEASKAHWERDGRVVTSDGSRIHVLDNGTLVLTGFEEEEIKQYNCVHNNKHVGVIVSEKAIYEKQPVVIISPRQYQSQIGDTISFHCQLVEGDPLTTQISWYHNRLPVIMADRHRVFPNNSLIVNKISSADRGEYRCVASNSRGRAHAPATVIIPGYGDDEESASTATFGALGPGPGSSGGANKSGSKKFTSSKSSSLPGWKPWSKWSSCSASCGGGSRNRMRQCQIDDVTADSARSKKICPGPSVQFQRCNEKPCKLNQEDRVRFSVSEGISKIPADTGTTIRHSRSTSMPDTSLSFAKNVPYEARSRLSGDMDGVRFTSSPIQYNLSRAGQESEIHVHIDALPLNLSSGMKAMLGLAATPCWVLTTPAKTAADVNQLTEGRFHQISRYDFDSGESLEVRNLGHGVNRGYLVMETVVNGKLPGLLQQRQEIIAMEPYVEFLVQSAPGHLHGYGNGVLRVGSADSVPLSWQHNVTYQANGRDLPYKSERIQVFDINLHNVGDGRRPSYDFSLRATAHADRRCPAGFAMPEDASYCTDVDECKTGLVQCEATQECINTVGSYRCLPKCSQGFVRSENGQCVDLDECWILERVCKNACQYGCYNYPGAFYCHCPPGFVRFRLPKPRLPNLLTHNALYTAFWLLTTPAVHVGNDFCSDMDECKTGVAGCSGTEECVNTMGGYWCREQCQTGYRRNEPGVCVDVDECRELIPCHPDQTCINTPGLFKCLCPAGLIANGPRDPCQDIDECSFQPPVCSHGCQNTRGSYVCTCPSGSVLTTDGRTCNAIDFGFADSASLDEAQGEWKSSLSTDSGCPEGSIWNGALCEAIQTNCGLSAPCQYHCRGTSSGGKTCICPSGYRLASDGYSCTDMDECREGTAACSAGSMCFNERGSYRCLRITCPIPYTFSVVASSCLLICNGFSNTNCTSIATTNRPRKIKIETVALPNGIPAFQDVLRLTAFDGKGRQLRRAHFSLTAADSNQDDSQFPPFAIRLVDGKGTLFTVRKLVHENLYKLKVYASSYDDFDPTLKYQTEFLIFISVSRFPF